MQIQSLFHIIIPLTLKAIEVDVFNEVHSSKGRADVIVKTKQCIYALELKLDTPASEALAQIFEKGYLQPYMGDERKKLAIGIAFSSDQRGIAGYQVKEL